MSGVIDNPGLAVRPWAMDSTSPQRHPSDETAILPVTLGTVVWIGALVIVGVVDGTAPVDGQVWWFAVTVIGSLTGVFGVLFLRWRRSRRRERN